MISVVICTYNRPKKVTELVGMMQKQTLKPHQIVVVDSSDAVNIELNSNASIDYIRSSHKNQPYQRYLGYLAAKYDWLLYLDDDMEPVSETVLAELEVLIKEVSEAVAFAIRFENVHEDTALAAMPKSNINKGSSTLRNFVRWITAYPELPDGKFGWNGVRGQQPKRGFTEWFSGGAFLAKRDVIFQNFNFGLFKMFEDKIGMGEDMMISYSIAQHGKIWATEKIHFYHNDLKDSTYTPDVESYNRRVIYSRLFLSTEKARLTSRNRIAALIRYVYYSFWRFTGLILNYILHPTKKRWNAIKGFHSGFFKSFELLSLNFENEKTYWDHEAKKDLQ